MKRTIALLLCLMMVTGLLAGCSVKDDGQTKDPVTTTDTTQTNTDTDNKDETEGEEVVSDVLTELTLPLTEEKEEISVWSFFQNDYVEDPNELPAVQKMEEITNVHVNWNTVSLLEAAEKFGLMLASGDIPDVMYSPGVSYPGGAEMGVEEGVFMELTEVVAKYMPTYRELRTSTESLAKDTMTDSGKLVAIYGLNSSDTEIASEKEWGGLGIRKDMLDDLGMDIPTTIDDWHEVLTAAKDAGADAPLLIGGTGYSIGAPFMTAFGVLPEFYQENGVVKYGPAEEGYRQWVELFRQWYSEGLIDPNFVSTNASYMGDVSYTVTGRSIAYPVVWTLTDNAYVLYGMASDPDVRVVGVANPVLNKGDTPISTTCTSGVQGNPIWISADCENIELVAKWLDFQFTTEGMLLNFYGIEGVTYTVEDGIYVFTDAVMNNPDYPSASSALSTYVRGNGLGRYNWESMNRYQPGVERLIVAEDTWCAQDFSRDIPLTVSMTQEEGTAYSSLYVAIQTLVNEKTVNYIMGSESMDTYDAFVESLYQYGLEECIGYKQAALDRYNNRK